MGWKGQLQPDGCRWRVHLFVERGRECPQRDDYGFKVTSPGPILFEVSNKETWKMIEANIFTEKRLSPRVTVKIPVKYRLLKDKGEIESVLERRKKDQNAETIDVSLGGMYIVSEKRLEIGSVLHIEIALGDYKHTLKAFAEVVWANKTGGGLRFLTMKDEDVESLRFYLDNLPYPSGG
jgi:hypothetical protein